MKYIVYFFLGIVLISCQPEQNRSDKTINVSSGEVQRIEDFPSDYITHRTIDIWLPEGYSKECLVLK
ncbi:MAG: hypothetical protein K9H58_19015 [Bacteroidales bacterium]|nr:hypothetical protein [Bacteroidales bacterium]